MILPCFPSIIYLNPYKTEEILDPSISCVPVISLGVPVGVAQKPAIAFSPAFSKVISPMAFSLFNSIPVQEVQPGTGKSNLAEKQDRVNSQDSQKSRVRVQDLFVLTHPDLRKNIIFEEIGFQITDRTYGIN